MFFFVFCSLLSAQDFRLSPGQLEVSGTAGGITQSGTSYDHNYKMAVGFGVHAGITPRLAGGVRFAASNYHGDVVFNTRPYSASAALSSVVGEVRYTFTRKRAAPYITGGIGGLGMRNVQTTATDPLLRPSLLGELNLRQGWQVSYDLGGGASISITQRLVLALGLRSTTGRYTNAFLQPHVGIAYRFH